MALIVREFHANLPHRDDTRVFVRGIWVPFDSETVNRAFELWDMDSELYQNLWRSPNYAQIFKTLTDNKVPWKTNSANKVLSFSRSGLTPSSRV